MKPGVNVDARRMGPGVNIGAGLLRETEYNDHVFAQRWKRLRKHV
jgi:hypothetical protein